MAKGFRKPNLVQGIKALYKNKRIVKELLDYKYDPAIMAQILETPELKEGMKQQRIDPKNVFEMALFKGMCVKTGAYQFFIDNKVNEVK